MPTPRPPVRLNGSDFAHLDVFHPQHGTLTEVAPNEPSPAIPWGRMARAVILCCGLWQAGAALGLDLNAATEAELDGLTGFGPAFTARVMQARAERPFQDWADFMRRVKGVREPTAWRLSRQGARIQQAPFVASTARVSRD
jgi:hypothetical protein